MWTQFNHTNKSTYWRISLAGQRSPGMQKVLEWVPDQHRFFMQFGFMISLAGQRSPRMQKVLDWVPDQHGFSCSLDSCLKWRSRKR